MSDETSLTHHQQTVRLWDLAGREVAAGDRRPGDRRRRRRSLAKDAIYHLDIIRPGGKQTVEVAVHDVSATGACVFSSVAVPIGQPVKLRTSAAGPGPLVAVNARVAYCRQAAGNYQVGLEFCAPP